MRRLHVVFVVVALFLMISASACSSEPPPEATSGSEISEKEFEDFDPNNFDDRSTNIDNAWFPLKPGTQFVYEGITVEDGEEIPHRVVFTVTDLTKVIDGVRAVVVWDQDFADDELVESEIAFFAQDKDGVVWHLGQYPEEYEDGEFVDAPGWIHGLEEARAGIAMKVEPRLNTRSYSQGWAPAVDWTDRAQVYKMSQQTCVPVNCYGDVLVMDEFSQEEPGAFQQKYYARNVGNIRVGWRGDDPSQEELALVDLVQLDREAMAEVRAAALALEQHAYEISQDVYAQTTPVEAPTETELEAAEPSDRVPPVAELRELDPSNFDDGSTNIDNEWFPLQPGSQWVYEGLTVEDGEETPHRVIFTVTDLTKVIDGVRAVVVWDQDFADGELVETEIAFFAQDKDGVVWHLGQYPEEYEDGKFVDAPGWIHGIEEARAGIAMKVEPQLGAPSYYQGWAPAVDWTDYAQVDQMGQETCVPFDCYQDVLVTAETSLDEQGAFQLKYYASGVGNVRVGWRGDDETQEELELVEFSQLDEEAMAEARAEALALEQRAYEISQDVYAQTTPAEQLDAE